MWLVNIPFDPCIVAYEPQGGQSQCHSISTAPARK